jgi:hypothetical protein
MTRNNFLEKARNRHGYKYSYDNIPDKITLKDTIEVIYEGISYYQKASKHLLGKCPEKITLNKTTNEFIRQSKEMWGDKFDYSITEYINANTKIKVIDKETGNIIEQLPNNHLYGHLSNRIEKYDFIQMSKLVSDYRYDYSKCDYVNKITKVKIICPIHGDFDVYPHLHLNQGYVCSECYESEAIREISKFLKKYDINYSKQHRFKDCRNRYELPFDFFIPSIRGCIDFRGKQYYEPSKYFGGVESYNQLLINNRIKLEYCEEHFIELIIVRYDQIEDIHQILWEALKNKIKIRI